MKTLIYLFGISLILASCCKTETIDIGLSEFEKSFLGTWEDVETYIYIVTRPDGTKDTIIHENIQFTFSSAGIYIVENETWGGIPSAGEWNYNDDAKTISLFPTKKNSQNPDVAESFKWEIKSLSNDSLDVYYTHWRDSIPPFGEINVITNRKFKKM